VEAFRDLADDGGEIARTPAPTGKGASGGGPVGDMASEAVLLIMLALTC
jgi:hypothetical protein